jgi:hypothetical protein
VTSDITSPQPAGGATGAVEPLPGLALTGVDFGVTRAAVAGMFAVLSVLQRVLPQRRGGDVSNSPPKVCGYGVAFGAANRFFLLFRLR